MSEHLIERLQQWPSRPAGADPFASTYVGDLMKEAADEIAHLRATIGALDALDAARKADRDRSFPCPKCGVERGAPIGGCAQNGCPTVVNERIYALAT